MIRTATRVRTWGPCQFAGLTRQFKIKHGPPPPKRKPVEEDEGYIDPITLRRKFTPHGDFHARINAMRVEYEKKTSPPPPSFEPEEPEEPGKQEFEIDPSTGFVSRRPSVEQRVRFLTRLLRKYQLEGGAINQKAIDRITQLLRELQVTEGQAATREHTNEAFKSKCQPQAEEQADFQNQNAFKKRVLDDDIFKVEKKPGPSKVEEKEPDSFKAQQTPFKAENAPLDPVRSEAVNSEDISPEHPSKATPELSNNPISPLDAANVTKDPDVSVPPNDSIPENPELQVEPETAEKEANNKAINVDSVTASDANVGSSDAMKETSTGGSTANYDKLLETMGVDASKLSSTDAKPVSTSARAEESTTKSNKPTVAKPEEPITEPSTKLDIEKLEEALKRSKDKNKQLENESFRAKNAYEYSIENAYAKEPRSLESKNFFTTSKALTERAREAKRPPKQLEYAILTPSRKIIYTRANPFASSKPPQDLFNALSTMSNPERYVKAIQKLERDGWRCVGGGGPGELLVFERKFYPAGRAGRLIFKFSGWVLSIVAACLSIIFLDTWLYNTKRVMPESASVTDDKSDS